MRQAPVEDMQRRNPATGQSSATVARHRCGKPPRTHAPCDGRVTSAGRSPDLRVAALAPPSRDCPSGMSKQGSPPTVAGAVPELTRRELRSVAPASLLAVPTGDDTPEPLDSRWDRSADVNALACRRVRLDALVASWQHLRGALVAVPALIPSSTSSRRPSCPSPGAFAGPSAGSPV